MKQSQGFPNSTEEDAIIERVLGFCADGGTDEQADVMRIPVREYTDPAFLEREIATLFRQFPIVVGHVSTLAEPGDFFTHDLTGVPLLVTRARDGVVRAFMNVCRHRGARVESRTCGKASSFSCPYHAWTYGLDGALRGIRKAEGFGEIDKSEYGLVEVPAFERFGLLWVRPSVGQGDGELDIDAWLKPMAEQLGSIDLGGHTVFKSWALPRKMNWHIALEGFQEQYHFCTAHKHTACSAYLDNQGVYLDCYPHVRHAVPLAHFEKLADLLPEERSYRPNFMTQNYLFPCNFLQVMTDHVYVHTIVPTGIDSCIFACAMLIPEPATTEKAERYWNANYDVVRRVFDEDFEIGEGIQAGLAAGANVDFTIGRYEGGLQLARRALNDALAGTLKVPMVG